MKNNHSDKEAFAMYYPSEVKKYGSIVKAIIVQQIRYWSHYNKAMNKNYYENTYWTYNTLIGWEKLTGINSKTLSRNIKELVDDKIIKIGNFNKLPFDRTIWYSIDENTISTNDTPISTNEKSEFLNQEIRVLDMRKESSQNETTIPEIHRETTKKLKEYSYSTHIEEKIEIETDDYLTKKNIK
jgi:hypothetical protein